MTFDPTLVNAATETGNGHATRVAGLMISTDPTLRGVSPEAILYSVGDNGTGPDYDPESAVSTQFLITQPFILAVNMSFGNPLVGSNILDGDQLLTQFVDWSAHADNILYVVSGNEDEGGIPIPTDNYNGMTIASSDRVGAVWQKVRATNNFSEDANGERTSISLVAPGDGFPMADRGSTSTTMPHPAGTSYAAPQVTAAAALLQEFALNQFAASQPRWDADAQQHEVIKAVLMNSADKLIDDGSHAPPGGLLGMRRTITDVQLVGIRCL
jgi:subtilisin family serine protease